MTDELLTISLRLVGAILIGAFIGLERSYHGRPAGFRTHALVCLSSSLLVLLTVYQTQWMPAQAVETIRLDPTRMAQGIMTGIGFLGAGVIFKEGLTVRGLTTAASIWMTASIGILVGVGFWFPALMAAIATLLILSTFRLIEAWLPSQFYAHFHVRFKRKSVMDQTELTGLVASHHFSVANVHSRLSDKGELFEYRMVMRSISPDSGHALAEALLALPQVVEFRISPTGD